MVKDNILHIEFGEFGNHYEMNFDLGSIAKMAGAKKTDRYQDDHNQWRSSTLTLLTFPQARKIINAILEFADPEDFDAVDEAFQENKKLYAIWKEKLDKWKE